VTTVKISSLIFVLFANCAAQSQLRVNQTPDCCRDASAAKLSSANAIDLPIELYRDYLVVEGSIGNLDKLALTIAISLIDPGHRFGPAQ
jgi:hypothetical protein